MKAPQERSRPPSLSLSFPHHGHLICFHFCLRLNWKVALSFQLARSFGSPDEKPINITQGRRRMPHPLRPLPGSRKLIHGEMLSWQPGILEGPCTAPKGVIWERTDPFRAKKWLHRFSHSRISSPSNPPAHLPLAPSYHRNGRTLSGGPPTSGWPGLDSKTMEKEWILFLPDT